MAIQDFEQTCSSLSVAADGSVWALNEQGTPWMASADEGVWQPVNFGTDEGAFVQIAAGAADNVWLRRPNGTTAKIVREEKAWRLDNDPRGTPLQWLTTGSDGSAFGVDDQGAVLYWNGDASTWDPAAPQPPEPLARIAAASKSDVWGTTGTSLHRFDGQAWMPVDSTGIGDGVICVAVGSDGSAWAVDENEAVYFLVEGKWYRTGAMLQYVSAVTGTSAWGIDGDDRAVNLNPRGADWGERGAATGGGQRPRWDTEDPYNEARSTHLWIVNRAAELARQAGEVGEAVYNLVQPGKTEPIGEPFHDQLRQGLYDADFVEEYNNEVISGVLKSATYKSHFYDPDTERNWLFEKEPTALTQGAKYFHAARDAYIDGRLGDAGYALGLSLHYLTDLTQPMHAANFTYLDSVPVGYHQDFESTMLDEQRNCSIPDSYTPNNSTDPADYLRQVARTSKSLYKTYILPTTDYRYRGSYPLTDEYLDALRNACSAGMMRDAVSAVAQYLVAWRGSVDPANKLKLAPHGAQAPAMASGAGRLWVLYGDGSQCQKVVSTLWPTFTAGTLGSVRGNGGQAVADWSDIVWMAWTSDADQYGVGVTGIGGNWQGGDYSMDDSVTFQYQSSVSPGLAGYNDKLYLAFTDTSNTLHLMACGHPMTIEEWHEVSLPSAIQTSQAPALVSCRNLLYIAYVDALQVPHILIYDGQRWVENVPLAEASRFGPALASRNDPAVLYLGWTGIDFHPNILAFEQSPDGYGVDLWHGTKKTLTGEQSSAQPALAVFQGELYLAWKDQTAGQNMCIIHNVVG